MERALDPALVVEHWQFVAAYVDVDALVRRLDHEGGLARALSADAFRPELAGLYAAVVRHAGGGRDFVAWCREGLAQVDVAHWATALPAGDADAGALTSLGAAVAAAGVPVGLGDAFRAALTGHAEGVLTETTVNLAPVDEVARASLLAADYRTLWRDDLLDLVRRHSGAGSAAFFAAFGAELAAAGDLRAPTHAAVSALAALLERRNAAGVQWLFGFLRDNPEWYTQLKPQHKTLLRDRVLEASTDGGDVPGSVGPLARDIAQLLRLRLPRGSKASRDE